MQVNVIQQIALDRLLIEAEERVVGLCNRSNLGVWVIGNRFIQNEGLNLHRQTDI